MGKKYIGADGKEHVTKDVGLNKGMMGDTAMNDAKWGAGIGTAIMPGLGTVLGGGAGATVGFFRGLLGMQDDYKKRQAAQDAAEIEQAHAPALPTFIKTPYAQTAANNPYLNTAKRDQDKNQAITGIRQALMGGEHRARVANSGGTAGANDANSNVLDEQRRFAEAQAENGINSDWSAQSTAWEDQRQRLAAAWDANEERAALDNEWAQTNYRAKQEQLQQELARLKEQDQLLADQRSQQTIGSAIQTAGTLFNMLPEENKKGILGGAGQQINNVMGWNKAPEAKKLDTGIEAEIPSFAKPQPDPLSSLQGAPPLPSLQQAAYPGSYGVKALSSKKIPQWASKSSNPDPHQYWDLTDPTPLPQVNLSPQGPRGIPSFGRPLQTSLVNANASLGNGTYAEWERRNGRR